MLIQERPVPRRFGLHGPPKARSRHADRGTPSPRPYKDPWPFDRAIAEIERLSGTQFDPGLVAAFLPIAAELHREWFPVEEAVAAS
jgi:hypothetical protein